MMVEDYIPPDRETDYDIEKALVFDYNFTNNSIIFNNPIQNNSSYVGENITFTSNLLVNGLLQVGNDPNFIPPLLPTDGSFVLPFINSLGTIQGTDILITNNGNVNFYACSGQTYLYNTVHLNGSINITSLSQITLLQEAMNTKLNISDAYTSTTVNSLLSSKLDISVSDITTASLLTLINTKANSTDVTSGLNTKLNLSDAYTSTTVNSLLSSKLDVSVSDITTASLLTLINTKANSTDVTSGLNTKLNLSDAYTSTTVNSLLSSKLDISVSDITTASLLTLINTKANSTDVTSGLNTKLNISDAYTSTTVNSLLSSKLDISVSDITTASLLTLINTKANSTDVTSGLNTKLNLSDAYTSTTVNSLLSSKLDISVSDITTASLLTLINTKANSTDVTSGLNTKLNLSDAYTSTTVNSLLSSKLDISVSATTTNSIISLVNLKATITDVSATFNTKLNISDAYTSTTVNSLLTLKAPINNPTFTGTIAGITKAMVSLGNVDNTSDVNKPISTATQTALNTKLDNFWVAGRITQAGAISFNVGSNILISSNITANGTGSYIFTIPTHPNGANYAVMATPSSSGAGSAFFISTFVSTSTTFVIYTYNSAGNPASQPFMYHTIP